MHKRKVDEIEEIEEIEEDAPKERKVQEVEEAPLRKRKRKTGKIKIREFFPDEDLELGYRIAVLGRTGSGKSTVVWALCHAYAPVIDMAIVMCPTAEENNYPDIVPRCCIYEEFDEEVVLGLLAHQKKCRIKYGVEGTKKILIILDDLSFDSKMFRLKGFRKLINNGRHAQITVIITSQFALDMPTFIRSQLHLTFTACEITDNVLDRLHENYFSLIDKYQDFKRIMRQITKNRHMLVMHNKFTEDINVSNLLYWYKAPFPVAQFKMGAPEGWEEDARCYVDDMEEREKEDRKIRAIQRQIEEDKQPIYDIVKDTSRPHIPSNTLGARHQKRKIVYDANPAKINPKAMDRVYQGPSYNPHTARAYHSREDVARKRMRMRYGS